MRRTILAVLLNLLAVPAQALAGGALLGSVEMEHYNVEVEGNRQPVSAEFWRYGGLGGFALALTGNEWLGFAGLRVRVEAGGTIVPEPWLFLGFHRGPLDWALGVTRPETNQPLLRQLALAQGAEWLNRIQWTPRRGYLSLEVARQQAPADLRNEKFSGEAAGGWLPEIGPLLAGVDAGTLVRHQAGHDTGGTNWRRPEEAVGQQLAAWVGCRLRWRESAPDIGLRTVAFLSTGHWQMPGAARQEESGRGLVVAADWRQHWRQHNLAMTLRNGWYEGEVVHPQAPVALRDRVDPAGAFVRVAALAADWRWPATAGIEVLARIEESVRWRQSDPVWYNLTEVVVRWELAPLLSF